MKNELMSTKSSNHEKKIQENAYSSDWSFHVMQRAHSGIFRKKLETIMINQMGIPNTLKKDIAMTTIGSKLVSHERRIHKWVI